MTDSNRIDDAIENDILCYISSSRDALSQDRIILNASSYYNPETIKKAKDIICKIANARNISRRSSEAYPKPEAANVEDICDCFEKIETERLVCPRFLAGGYTAFPPQGFEYISPLIGSLRDEVTTLRTETAGIRENNNGDLRALNNTNIVAQDVVELKTLVQGLVTEWRTSQTVEVSRNVAARSMDGINDVRNALPSEQSSSAEINQENQFQENE